MVALGTPRFTAVDRRARVGSNALDRAAPDPRRSLDPPAALTADYGGRGPWLSLQTECGSVFPPAAAGLSPLSFRWRCVLGKISGKMVRCTCLARILAITPISLISRPVTAAVTAAQSPLGTSQRRNPEPGQHRLRWIDPVHAARHVRLHPGESDEQRKGHDVRQPRMPFDNRLHAPSPAWGRPTRSCRNSKR